MRHGHSKKRLPYPADHANAVLRNLAVSLITHGRIETTVKRAKVLRPFVERLITKCKRSASSPDYSIKDHCYRLVLSALRNKQAVAIATRVWAPHFLDRPGGYTRILRTRFRKGDCAEMAIIEFVLNGSDRSGPVDGTDHAAVLAQLDAYQPSGVQYMPAWRQVGHPSVKLTIKAAKLPRDSVDFTLSFSLPDVSKANRTAIWPTFCGNAIPMNLRTKLSVPKTAELTARDCGNSHGIPAIEAFASLRKMNLSLTPERPVGIVEGRVSFPAGATWEHYCIVTVDGPTGELFHAEIA